MSVEWLPESPEDTQGLPPLVRAFDAVPYGVVVLSSDHRIAWCNAAAAIHLDLDPNRDRGQPLTNLARFPALVEALTGQGPQDLQVCVAGSDAVLSLQLRPLAPGQVLLLTQDVTEAERMDTMRKDFVAHVSHEIRTPLTVLSGFVETLQSIRLEDDEQDRIFELMRQQTQRIERLVADLLTLARLEANPKPRIDHWTPLRHLMHAAHDDGFHLSAGRHQVVLAAVPEVEVAADENDMLSAVSNLVSNAIRYTPEGGHIELRARHREDGYLEIAVQDNGIGIERQHLPRITQRFYRVDKSRSRETGGTGLGLSIVKHAISRHGGELLVDSRPQQGSTFTLTLPPARVRVIAPSSG